MSGNKTDWDPNLYSALWAFRTVYKVTIGMTPSRLVYGCEAVVPMEFIVQSLKIAAENKMLPEDSINHRNEQLLKLHEDRLKSCYTSDIILQRRQAWIKRNIKFKVFLERRFDIDV